MTVPAEEQFARIRSFQYAVDVEAFVLTTAQSLKTDAFVIKVVAEYGVHPQLHILISVPPDAPLLLDEDVHMNIDVRGYRAGQACMEWKCVLRPARRDVSKTFIDTENGMHTASAVFEDHVLRSVHVMASAFSLPGAITSSAASPIPDRDRRLHSHSDASSVAQEAH